MANSRIPRCQAIPLPDHQIAFEIDGVERLRWHFAADYPRPFFYPLTGPSGASLTRMGHPGAPNHDHHRSIWFAHHKVLGIDFWSDQTQATVRQKQWLALDDSDEEARMAVLLGWYDGHDPKEFLEQELVAAIRPGSDDGETLVELQATFRPIAESLELGKTNFGFLAVRVAKSISAHFGGGQLKDSEGRIGERAIFGRSARWMDYSGPVASDDRKSTLTEGITYFDHPANPGHPTKWHVREDGWMGASLCMDQARTTTRKQPLVLRYLLYAHQGGSDREKLASVADAFGKTRSFEVIKSAARHQQFEIRRADQLP